MKPNCLQHCLTDSEYRHFEELGYLMIEDALPADRLKRLSQVCGRMLTAKRNDGLGPYTSFDETNVIGKDPVFVEMIDCPTTFPKVWGVLGWNIYLYHTGLIVNPPSDPRPMPGIPRVAWHQDSMRVNDEIESSPRPRLSLKVGGECSFGLQAEVLFFRAFGSDGGLEPTATPDPKFSPE